MNGWVIPQTGSKKGFDYLGSCPMSTFSDPVKNAPQTTHHFCGNLRVSFHPGDVLTPERRNLLLSCASQ